MLVVDSGDLFFKPRAIGSVESHRARANLIGKAFLRMKADAINIGDEDLAQGIEFLQAESTRGLPLISANLISASSGKRIFPAYRIKRVEDLRIAFIGLMSNWTGPLSRSVADIIRVKNPAEALREILPEVRAQADLAILLSDLGSHGDALLVRSIPDLPIVLGGHEGRFQKYPQMEGRSYLFQSYTKGMYVGFLRLNVKNPSASFHDQGKPDQIRDRLSSIERSVFTLQRQKGKSPQETIDQRIRDLERQKAALLEEMDEWKKSPKDGNLLRWNLYPLEKSLGEDENIRKEIQKAGFVQD